MTWTEITPVFNEQGTPTTKSTITPLKDKLLCYSSRYIAYINNKYVYSNIFYKSTDGIAWDSISSILPEESPRSLFKVGDTLCLITNVNKYKSPDGGITWNAEKFWDTDGELFPDDFYSSAYSDSITVISYQERPSQIQRIAMFKNGEWKILPTDILNITPNAGKISIAGNRCLIAEDISYSSGYSVRSFKLY